MQITRRKLLKLVGASAGAVSVGGVTLSLTGCTKADVENWATTVDDTVASILTQLGQTALAATIQGYLTQFDEAVSFWNSTAIATELISAVQDLEIALGDVGLPPIWVAAADVVIGALEEIVNLVGGNSPAVPAAASVMAHQLSVKTRALPAAITSKRKAAQAWNAAVAGTPLATHTLKVPLF
jgi:hypothetical protein